MVYFEYKNSPCCFVNSNFNKKNNDYGMKFAVKKKKFITSK